MNDSECNQCFKLSELLLNLVDKKTLSQTSGTPVYEVGHRWGKTSHKLHIMATVFEYSAVTSKSWRPATNMRYF